MEMDDGFTLMKRPAYTNVNFQVYAGLFLVKLVDQHGWCKQHNQAQVRLVRDIATADNSSENVNMKVSV